MNLHGIVRRAITTVNPDVDGVLRRSRGYETSPSGVQVPLYAAPIGVRLQVQPLEYKDLLQVSGLNLNGEARGVYLRGQWDGVLRAEAKGGDLLEFVSPGEVLPRNAAGPQRTQRWLLVKVLEVFPDWSKVAVVRQM